MPTSCIFFYDGGGNQDFFIIHFELPILTSFRLTTPATQVFSNKTCTLWC